MNFLSLNEMFRISDQGKPIFGVNLSKINNIIIKTQLFSVSIN